MAESIEGTLTRSWLPQACFIIGLLLVGAGFALSSDVLVDCFRSVPVQEIPHPLVDQLLIGGLLFKMGGVVLGLFLMAAWRLNIWTEREEPDTRTAGQSSLPWLIIGLVGCAAVLRLYELGSGLWYDEIVTYVKYVKMPMGDLLTTYDSENQHFLFSVLAHLCFIVFGDHVWAVRLPAMVFGVGSVWALYALGRQVATEREALLAAAFFTFSYHHIWFSQNARGYSGLLFWTLFSSWIFLRALPGQRVPQWMAYAGAVALGMYTHATMLFVVVGHFVVFLVRNFHQPARHWAKGWIGFVFGFVLSGLLTFQLYALVIPQLLATMGMTTAVQDWNSPLWTLLEIVKGLKIGLGVGIVVLIGGGGILAMGLWSFFKETPEFVGVMLVPGILGPALVLSTGHPLWPRFFFFLAGFGVLTLVRGLMVFGSRLAIIFKLSPSQGPLVGLALCLTMISFSAISIVWAYGPKQDFGGALTFIEAQRKSTDAVVSVGLASFTYQQLYGRNWKKAESIQELNAIRSRYPRTWIVYTMPVHLESYFPEILSSIESDFEQVKVFPGTLGGGAVYVGRASQLVTVGEAYSEKTGF